MAQNMAELQNSQSNDVYYLLHNGLYRKDFYPLVFESRDGDDPYWHETNDLADATFFMSKQVAEEARKQALDDEQGTNWYDSDVVIVKLRGKLSMDEDGQLEVTDFVETQHEGYYTLKL